MRIPLLGGAYRARSVIANAQRCVNLYPENNPESSQAPVPVTHYWTPGLRLLMDDGIPGRWRGLYRATDGQLFGVRDARVYYVAPDWTLSALGSIAPGLNPVSMKDNGLGSLVLVDGTINGYVIDLETHGFSQISDPAFYGADRVEYLETYLVFNRPGTNQFYTTLSNTVSFDALDIAAKSGGPDPVSTIIAKNREIWPIGLFTSEVWGVSGSVDFPFAPVPGVLIQHGCIATHSVAQVDVNIFWLAQDDKGDALALKTDGYSAKIVSTPALTAEWQTYATISDAVGYVYQQGAHTFWVLVFPSADKTWVYDLSTGHWHQWASVDRNGKLHRHRSNCYAFAYGENVVGDFANGKLYALDPQKYTDDGDLIVRIRTFPHLVEDGNRVSYQYFRADVSVGDVPGHMTDDIEVSDFNWDFNSDFGANPSTLAAPRASLRYSDTKGASWNMAVERKIGSTGEYLASPTWWRLGMARDRVFELSWAVNGPIALNGAFIGTAAHRT